jgi:hypothetical protein
MVVFFFASGIFCLCWIIIFSSSFLLRRTFTNGFDQDYLKLLQHILLTWFSEYSRRYFLAVCASAMWRRNWDWFWNIRFLLLLWRFSFRYLLLLVALFSFGDSFYLLFLLLLPVCPSVSILQTYISYCKRITFFGYLFPYTRLLSIYLKGLFSLSSSAITSSLSA